MIVNGSFSLRTLLHQPLDTRYIPFSSGDACSMREQDLSVFGYFAIFLVCRDGYNGLDLDFLLFSKKNPTTFLSWRN